MKLSTTTLLISLLFSSCTGKASLHYSSESNSVSTHQLQAPLPPKETLTRLKVPDGFNIHVFAHEPDIVNPIALTWDERGRLWVVESTNYPHDHVGEESGTDRITICEDTDGDYRADRFIRFAENLPLTTGIALVKGGAIVGQAPDLVLLKDTDGNDRADEKLVIVDNAFGTYDTHAVMSNLKIGIDNFLWGSVWYSGLFEPAGRAPDSDALILSRGIFRVRTNGTDLEPIAEFNNNTWGLGIGEDNTIYGSSTNNNHSIVIGVPLLHPTGMNVANVQSHYLVKHSSPHQLQQVGFRDGYTIAGAFPYNGRRFPSEYWGTLMVTEPSAHVVHTIQLEQDGSIERGSEGDILNILSSSDKWVTPVFADIGPDENLWVADRYNPVIQHTPDRGTGIQIWNDGPSPDNAHLNPLRDREYGRIYVISYGEVSLPQKTLSYDDPAGMLEALQSTNQFWRLTAQRMLVESDAEELENDLRDLVTRHELDETGFDPGAVHALWVLKGLGREDALASISPAALIHPSSAVRKAGIQTLSPTSRSAEFLIQYGAFRDEDLHVRLTALLAAGDFGFGIHPRILPEARKALVGGDLWILSAYDAITPIGMVKREPDPVVKREPRGFPPARLMLTAPDGLMRFESPILKAFVGQEITIDFENLHPDLHNAVVLSSDTDVAAFGKDLDSYMTNPSSSTTGYIPPARAGQVISSTDVLSQNESASIAMGPLSKGVYTFLCTVPGHWALMQGTLEILDPPLLRRNNARWTWAGADADLAPIVYLAGSANRSSQSHYHARVFGFSDGQVLFGTGDRTFEYTEASDKEFVELLQNASLLALANNKPVASEESRQAIMQHVEAGHPLMIIHPASWYNWKDWPAYNEFLVGGGARSHEPLQEFTVEIIQPGHPLMDGMPERFEITDELYRSELLPDAHASILAIGRSHETDDVYPVIWTRQVGEATILVNTLGHDDDAHDLAAYKRVLSNARRWLIPD